ncbi:hypothetical protein AMTRI_Chr02g262980 [Amborella trichopoda]
MHWEPARVPSRMGTPHEGPHAWLARTSALTHGEPARVPSCTQHLHEYPHARGACTSSCTQGEPARAPAHKESLQEWLHAQLARRSVCCHKSARTHGYARTYREPAQVPARLESPYARTKVLRVSTHVR